MFGRLEDEHITTPQAHRLSLCRLIINQADNVLMVKLPEYIQLMQVRVMELRLKQFGHINSVVLCELKQTESLK